MAITWAEEMRKTIERLVARYNPYMIKRQIFVAIAASLIVALTMFVGGQDQGVTYHDFAAIPLTPVGSMQARAFLADTSGIAMGVMPPGMKQAPNHHEQEQITFSVEGAFDMNIGGERQHLEHSAALIPPNVEHPIIVGDHPATMMEYQAIRRTDWLPPYPRLVTPQSPEPMSVPAGQQITIDFSLASGGWQAVASGARWKRITGKTIQATLFDLAKAGATVEVAEQTSGRERLVYVLSGRIASSAAGSKRQISKETVIVVPVRTSVGLESVGQADTVAVLFEPVD